MVRARGRPVCSGTRVPDDKLRRAPRGSFGSGAGGGGGGIGGSCEVGMGEAGVEA